MSTPTVSSTKTKNLTRGIRLPGSAFTSLALVHSGRVKLTEKIAKILAEMKEGFIKSRIE